MTTRIQDILSETGPILSGDLKSVLIEKYRLSEDAARKKISRAVTSKAIGRYSGFFSDNQSFLFLSEQALEEQFFDKLRDALSRAAKRLYYILLALEYHHGYLDEKKIGSYSMSPVQNLKGHRRLDAILQIMVSHGLIIKNDDVFSLNPGIAKNCSFNNRHSQGVEIAKNILLLQLNDWGRKLGFISYDKGSFHSEFGKFQWSFTAPSYVINLKHFENNKLVPGFMVGDVLIGNVVETDNVSFFLEKVKTVSSLPKAPRFLPMLLVDSVSEEALKALKENGVIIGFIDKLFGESYAELLRSLINLVTNAGAILKKDPDAFISLMENVEKLVSGKTNNLRGDLFELAVGYYHSQFCTSLDIGKKINFEGERREIDVLSKTGKTIYAVECKGYNYPIEKDMVDEWLGKKIPIIRKWILNNPEYSNWNIIFEIWSTGGFTDDAHTLLKERSEQTSKYQIAYYGKKEIIEKAKELPSPKFSQILREYFMAEGI